MICLDFTQTYQDTSVNSVTTTSFEFIYSTKLACSAARGHVYERLFREDTCCLRYGCHSVKQFLRSETEMNILAGVSSLLVTGRFLEPLGVRVVTEECVSTGGTLRGASTDMRRLTTGIRSEKCAVRGFRRCANVCFTQT